MNPNKESFCTQLMQEIHPGGQPITRVLAEKYWDAGIGRPCTMCGSPGVNVGIFKIDDDKKHLVGTPEAYDKRRQNAWRILYVTCARHIPTDDGQEIGERLILAYQARGGQDFPASNSP